MHSVRQFAVSVATRQTTTVTCNIGSPIVVVRGLRTALSKHNLIRQSGGGGGFLLVQSLGLQDVKKSKCPVMISPFNPNAGALLSSFSRQNSGGGIRQPPPGKVERADNFSGYTWSESSSSSSLLVSLAFSLCASILYAVWPAAEEEDEPNPSVLQKSLFKLFPVVSAAKPLSPTADDAAGKNISSGGTIGGGKGMGRRDQYNFIADVVDAVQNAVVCIQVNDHATANWYGVPQQASNGSGFIVREDGLILTNAHVVAARKRTSITVTLQDGRCFPGYVEDVDYESDLATIRINARGLPTLVLGCSAETRIGEWVVALGSPLNLSNTVTAGVVSSTCRGASEIGIQNDINYIQTDAAITFGNSGGPLVNLDGEAIGINSMKVTPGISFAVPSDHAKKFLQKGDARRASGKSRASRPYMGLTVLTLTKQLQREIESRSGITSPEHGVLVWQVVVGSPAYLGGLQPGDIITSINDKKVTYAAQVHDITKTDDKLVIKLQRGEKVYTFTVVPEHVLQ